MRALLEVLGLERVRLGGHDWGGFVGFLLCLRRPDLVERYLALNIIHPWPRLDPRGMLDLWRPLHAYVLSAPILGQRLLHHAPAVLRRVLEAAAVRPDTFTRAELDAFAEPLREPERARATAALYRAFVLRELPALVRGRYAGARLTTPTLFLFGTADWVVSAPGLRGPRRRDGARAGRRALHRGRAAGARGRAGARVLRRRGLVRGQDEPAALDCPVAGAGGAGWER